MTNWLESMQEKVNRENEAALSAEFNRLVAEGIIADTSDTRMAFYSGWFGFIKFKADKHSLNEAGNAPRAMATLCILFGAILIGLPSLSYFTIPANNLVMERAAMMIGSGFLVVALGYLLLRKSRKTYGNAVVNHRSRWGEKSVDD
jgi:amino acid transporter